MDVLVLSHAYEPIARVNWQKAFTWVFSGRAEVVENYGDRLIRGASEAWPMPSIVRLLRKVARKFFEKGIKFNRKNVWIRDKGCCQYCTQKVALDKFTYDHVLPRSRGGKTAWDNIVVSCLKCNQRKEDRTPEEAKMKLMNKPVKPKWLPGVSSNDPLMKGSIPDSWKDWLASVGYWNEPLDN